jgi:hydroxymethylbilane synthase
LMLGAVCEREDPRDVFIPHPSNPVRTFSGQRAGATIATGSLRRACQLLAVRPDLNVVDLRGNLQTRLRKLDESAWDGMLLARAGVTRLGLEDRIGEVLPFDTVLPAVGQGALGIEVRSADSRVLRLLAGLIHDHTLRTTLAERALLRRLEGGCQIPIGAHARFSEDGGSLHLEAIVGSLDGKTTLRAQRQGEPSDPEALGIALAEDLLGRGADTILRQIRGR